MKVEIELSNLPHDVLGCIVAKLPEVCADQALLDKSILSAGRTNHTFREATLEMFPVYSILMAAQKLQFPHLERKDGAIDDRQGVLSSKLCCRGTAAAAFLLAAGLLIGCSFLTSVGISIPICMFGGVAGAIGLFYLFRLFCGISECRDDPEQALRVVVINEEIKAIDSAKKSLSQKFLQRPQNTNFFEQGVEGLPESERSLFIEAKALSEKYNASKGASEVEVVIAGLAEDLPEDTQESARLLCGGN